MKMQKGENKLLYQIGNKSVIELCVEKFLNLDFVDETESER